MRVGLISFHSFCQPGGVRRHVLGLYEEFKKRGIEVKVIAPRRNNEENHNPDVILLGTSYPFNFSGSRSDFSVNFNLPAIRRVLREQKFDVLHFHNFGFPSSFQIIANSKSLNILTFHANIEGSTFLRTLPVFIYLFNKLIGRKIDGVIGVAPLNLEIFKDYLGPKVVIPNGINLERFNQGTAKIEKFNDPISNGAGAKLNLLFVGRLEKRKGLIYLLKAFRILSGKYPNLRLIIVGEGNLKKDCQNWVKKNNLKEIYFEGRVSDEKIPRYFAIADIFVSPATFGESFGVVLLEAMAAGLPVVAFANKGYQSFLAGKKGQDFLVPPKDCGALAQKIEDLIQNKSLRQEMGQWGKAEAQKYAWSKIADQVLNFYQLCQETKH